MAVRELQPHGPYVIGGMCMGAAVAVEMARELEQAGEEARLVLIDPRLPPPGGLLTFGWRVMRRIQRGDFRDAFQRHAPGPLRHVRTYETTTWSRLDQARNSYAATPIGVPASIVSSVDFRRGEWGVPPYWWKRYLRGLTSHQHTSASHETLFHVPHVDELSEAISAALESMR
jgi:thioesterase domain-containing protein